MAQATFQQSIGSDHNSMDEMMPPGTINHLLSGIIFPENETQNSTQNAT
jgi:hypothetical protein